jgi:hypothetical protein
MSKYDSVVEMARDDFNNDVYAPAGLGVDASTVYNNEMIRQETNARDQQFTNDINDIVTAILP